MQQGLHRFTFVATDAGGMSGETEMSIQVRHPGYDPEPPSECEVASTTHDGVVGPGTDPGEKDAQYVTIQVPSGTQRLEGTLVWFGGPAVDLDFYLLDADSNVVASSASTDPVESMVVNSPAPGTYIWKVLAFTNPDTAEFTIEQDLCVTQVLAVADDPAATVSLGASTPNPFKTLTTIRFAMPQPGKAKLEIYDLAGRRVRTLHDGWAAAGTHALVWDRRTDRGAIAASGVYFYRLEAADRVLGRKVIMLK